MNSLLYQIAMEATAQPVLAANSQNVTDLMVQLELNARCQPVMEPMAHIARKLVLLNFQHVINGLPPTANQSVTEILQLDALKEELQRDQEEIDLRVNGLISHSKPQFKLEFYQEMELQTLCQTHMLLHSDNQKVFN